MADSPEETALAADYFKQWTFQADNASPLVPKPNFEGPLNRNRRLKNKMLRKFLQYEEQGFGINLGWTDDAEPETAKRVTRWFFTRKGAGNKPISYGETIALGYGVSKSFIRNAHRDVGIDLDWSGPPVFEWKLLGGKKGQPVKGGAYLAIYNVKAKEPLIFFDRTAGGDIGWPSSKTWGAQLETQLDEKLRKAVKDHWKEAVVMLLAA